jgi:hypothetical protein
MHDLFSLRSVFIVLFNYRGPFLQTHALGCLTFLVYD